MLKREYEISGITEKLAEVMDRNFRKDLKLYRDQKSNQIKGKIFLNPYEVIRMRSAIREYNSKNTCVLQLNRVIKQRKGKRYRD